jgi:tight adherence protein C
MTMLALILSNVNWLIPAAVFGIFMFGAWAVVSLMADRDERPLERLKRLDPSAHAGGVTSNEPSLMRQQNRMQEILEMAAPALSRPLMPKSEFEQSQMKLRLANAGWRSENAVAMYLGLKLILTAVGAVVGAASFLRTGHISLQFWSVTAIGAGAGFYLPDIVLATLRKRRRDAIFYTLPDALDLMVVCVEAGFGA